MRSWQAEATRGGQTIRERVLLLGFDLSDNAYTRTWNLAQALRKGFEVRIVGPCFRDGRVFLPFRGEEPVPEGFDGRGMSLEEIEERLISKIEQYRPSVLYPCKPRPTSFGAVLRWISETGPKERRAAVLLDIEDWESEEWRAKGPLERLQDRFDRRRWNDPMHPHWTVRLERRVRRADAVTTVSRFLQRMFGGKIVPPGADVDLFREEAWTDEALRWRERLGIRSRERVLLFAGTPFLYKGLPELIQAVKGSSVPVKVVIVGGDRLRTTYERRELMRMGGRHLVLSEYVPHRELPGLLAMADAVAINHSRGMYTAGNVPAKMTEAMAMGRPLVVTDVSDLPLIAGDGGLVVPPGDVGALRDAIEKILMDPALAGRLGRRARQRAVRFYSHQAMYEKLKEIIKAGSIC